jgi:transcriptional regulator with XRE-family HTH domain
MGGRIRHWRQKRGLTGKELGLLIDTSKSFVSLLERDKAGPSVKTLALIADVLRVTLDYLVTGRGRPARAGRPGRLPEILTAAGKSGTRGMQSTPKFSTANQHSAGVRKER